MIDLRITRTGKIEHISIQGHNYYGVARYTGVVMQDMMGNDAWCGRYLAGLHPWTPEMSASMAELLIPININSSVQVTDPYLWIGANCIINMAPDKELLNYPISLTIIGNDDARSIPREDMFKIRNGNVDGVVDELALKKVQMSGTITRGHVERLLSEKYELDYHKGAVGVSGNHQDFFRVSEKDMSKFIDMTKNIGEEDITGLDKTRSLRTKECYMPATLFTGRT